MRSNRWIINVFAFFIILLPTVALAQSDKVKSAMTDLKAAVDTVVTKNGGAVSLFAKNGDQYVRVATTLKKEDGTSAVGTSMDPKNPAFAKLNAGEPYYGDATIFGKAYDTGYEPIKDASGAVIGAYFVGFPK
jgi:cache 3/cache 2 fusion protein